MNITQEEVIAALEAYEEGISELIYTADIKDKPVFINGLSIHTEVDFGGGEGDGEERWVVWGITKDGETSYWKTPGYYMSYNGTNFEVENTHEVKAKEKTVTVWE